jgi:GT2 family glycosyltransferase
MDKPEVSVIIPSYNRRAALRKVLEGLYTQTAAPSSFEVIAVLDGSTDGSAQMLVEQQKLGCLPELRWIFQENAGQAAARTNGARQAKSDLLLFIDDDVVPEPKLIETHLTHHQRCEALVVLGEAEIVRKEQDSLYHMGVWAWWEDTYTKRARQGRKPGSRDFCSGNISMRKVDFFKVGGFDPDFRGYGGEDYELGYRLLKAGIRFHADRQARAHHHHPTTYRGVLRATRQEAHGDALMGRKHPELRPGLRLARLPEGNYQYLALLALILPALGDLGTAFGLRILPIFERLKMRTSWLKLFDHLRGYAYWRGVREVFGSWTALKQYQQEAPSLSRFRLEISTGLPCKLPDLWVEGPSLIELSWKGRDLGTLKIESFIDRPLHEFLAEELARKMKAGFWLAAIQDNLALCDRETVSGPDSFSSLGSEAD